MFHYVNLYQLDDCLSFWFDKHKTKLMPSSISRYKIDSPPIKSGSIWMPAPPYKILTTPTPHSLVTNYAP